MKISNRLKKIGDLVDTNSLVLDIGCDHALLDIYLVIEKKFKRVIASDIASLPLEHAKENIKRYNLEDKIELRLGEGLKTYSDDIDTVVISGMGGRGIISILKDDINITKKVKTMIISPNNYQQDVRKFLVTNGFIIVDEEIIKEKNIFYQIIKAEKGKKKYSSKELYFGPIILEKKGPIFTEYYQKELKKKEIVLNLLPRHMVIRKFKLKREIKLIHNNLV